MRDLAYRDAAGAWCSEGRRRLNAARGEGAERQPLKVLAYQLNVAEQHVGRLLRGLEQPSAELIAKIWLALGIPGHAWGLAPCVNLTGSKDELPNTAEPIRVVA